MVKLNQALYNQIEKEIRLAMQQEKNSIINGLDRGAVAKVRTERIMSLILTGDITELTEVDEKTISEKCDILLAAGVEEIPSEKYLTVVDLDEQDKPRVEPICDQCGASIVACNAQAQARRLAERFYRQEGKLGGLACREKAYTEYPSLHKVKTPEEVEE